MKTKMLKSGMNRVQKLDVKSLKSKIRTPKLICTMLLLVLHMAPAFAQVADVETQLGEWGDNIKTILNAVVGIFSIGGGFLIFI